MSDATFQRIEILEYRLEALQAIRTSDYSRALSRHQQSIIEMIEWVEDELKIARQVHSFVVAGDAMIAQAEQFEKDGA